MLSGQTYNVLVIKALLVFMKLKLHTNHSISDSNMKLFIVRHNAAKVIVKYNSVHTLTPSIHQA